MPEPGDPDTGLLLTRAAAGDAAASHALLDRHRARLKRMVAVRTDDKFAARFDDSDVVQEALAEAAGRLPEYLAAPRAPFYPWLRSIARQKLLDYCRHHGAAKRAAGRDDPDGLPDRSAVELAARLACPRSSPSQAFVKRELRDRALAALATLDEPDREVLVLYYLERLSFAEAAAVLGVTEEAAKSRRRRAVSRLGALLQDLREEFGE